MVTYHVLGFVGVVPDDEADQADSLAVPTVVGGLDAQWLVHDFDELPRAVRDMMDLMSSEHACEWVMVLREDEGADDPRIMVRADRQDGDRVVISEIEGDVTLVLEGMVLDGLIPLEWPGFESN